jgi:hypothetical protein
VRLDEEAHLRVLGPEEEAQRLEIDEQRVGRDVVRPEHLVVDEVGRYRAEVSAVEHDVAAHLAHAPAAQVPQQHPEALIVELGVAVALEVEILAVAVDLGLPAVGRAEQLERRVRGHELHHRARVARGLGVQRERGTARPDLLYDDADRRLGYVRVPQPLRNHRRHGGETLENEAERRYY